MSGPGQKRLGRGLEALLGPVSREQAEREGSLRELPVQAVGPNPFQPRRTWNEEALAELAASIEASGLLQPVVVRPAREGRYELIAGERRWRAVQRLGWTRIPAVVREADDQTLLTLALIENLQRDELTPIDEALGYQRLIDEFALPQTEVARLVGRSRPQVSNMLRLLKLPLPVRELVEARRLSVGHARALLALTDERAMVKLAEAAVSGEWSVREMEERVRGGGRPARKPKRAATPTARSAEARQIEEVLRRRLGTDVTLVQKRKGRGTLAISWYSNDDLARLLELILGRPFDG